MRAVTSEVVAVILAVSIPAVAMAQGPLEVPMVAIEGGSWHCQTNLSRPAKGAGPRRSGRQLPPLGQGAR